MNTVADVLERIAIALERRSQPAITEGFFDYSSKKVYCNLTKGNGDGWYTLNRDVTTTQPPVFRGKVLGISFPTVERRGKDVRKFHLVMKAGEETVTFESGHDCFFSKTVLSAFANASPQVLAETIQLAVFTKTLRTEDQTLAVSLRDSAGTKLPCDWANDDDWKAIAALAIDNVTEAVASRQ